MDTRAILQFRRILPVVPILVTFTLTILLAIGCGSAGTTQPPSPGNVTVSVTPRQVSVTTGQAQAFTANVTGSTTTNVTWELQPGSGGSGPGTISASGIYTPPLTPGIFTVVARSATDTTVTGTATVAVTNLSGMFTYHNDLARDGANTQEYALTTSNVKAGTFGKRFSCAIDASAYAQPLWVANVAIGSGTHNVIVAATVHNSVYAFDADASPCQTYWNKSLMASGETWVTNADVGGSTDLAPDIGIVGTPVIDPTTSTIYVVSKSKTTGGSTTIHQRLHALSLIDGSEKFSGPVEIAFTSGGITFDPVTENQRCGLALVNGVVYITWASHGDAPTYYGWVAGYNASTLAQTSVFNDDPALAFGGIWMSGAAPAADSSNNLFLTTGNGFWDGTANFGDSFLKLRTSSVIAVANPSTDFFTPETQGTLNSGDLDLGSGGAVLLPDQASGPHAHLVIGGGKDANMYLLDRDNLGGTASNDAGAVQRFSVSNSIFATPAFWQNTIYLAPIRDKFKAYTFNPTSGLFTTTPSSQSAATFDYPGSTPSISAQGTTNGIVWAIERRLTPTTAVGPAILHAYDATNVGTELWNSGAASADQAGVAVKFTVPTVANGKVYIGTVSEIDVYGLTP